jgi:DNA-binding XRE family transcriptional regulator
VFIGLRKIRTERDVAADTLAEVLGLETKAAYYKKETGLVKFSLIEAKKLADYFGLPIEDLFFTNELSQ